MKTNIVNRILLATAAALVVVSQPLEAASLDGTTNPVVQATTWTASSGENATGVVWFLDGLAVPSGGSSLVTLDIVTPFSGNIALSTGTLVLSSDLVCNPGVTISNTGVLAAGGYAVHLLGDITLNNSITFANSIVFDGHGHTMTLDTSAAFILVNNMSVTFKNMTLKIADASVFTFWNTTSELVFDNTTVQWGADYTLSDGKVTIKNNCRFTGNQSARTLTYSTTGNFTINTKSCLHLDYNFTLKHSSTTTTNMVFTDRSSVLMMTGSTFDHSGASSTLVLQDGTLLVDHTSTIKASGASGAVDVGASGHEMYLVIMPSARLDSAGGTVSLKS